MAIVNKLSLSFKFKCSGRFSYVLFTELSPGTLVSLDHPSVLCNGVFGGHQEVLDGAASFGMFLYPMFFTNVLDTH